MSRDAKNADEEENVTLNRGGLHPVQGNVPVTDAHCATSAGVDIKLETSTPATHAVRATSLIK